MSRKPKKRGPTWFGNNRSSARNAPEAPYPPSASKAPNTLGAMWRQEPHGRGDTDAWLVGEPQAPDKSSPSQSSSEQYPDLPAWPPAPERNRFAAKGASDDTRDQLGGDPAMGGRAAPVRTQPGIPNLLRGRLPAWRLRALWGKVATPLRRPYMALAVGVGAVALCSIFGAVALGAAFLHGGSTSAQGTPGAGSSNGAVASASAGHATPSVTTTTTTTATPGNTPSPSPLTIAFTCASGTAGGQGRVCVRTLPHAALSLSVRYCDGSYAKGKAFHGASYADGGGNYTWRWNVNTSCLGAATATVTARSAGQTLTQSMTFTVTR